MLWFVRFVSGKRLLLLSTLCSLQISCLSLLELHFVLEISKMRYCDSNTSAMDKVYLLLHRTCLAIKRSAQSLEDDNLFTPFALDEVGTDLYDKDAHMYEGREVNYVRDG